MTINDFQISMTKQGERHNRDSKVMQPLIFENSQACSYGPSTMYADESRQSFNFRLIDEA